MSMKVDIKIFRTHHGAGVQDVAVQLEQGTFAVYFSCHASE